MAKIQGKRKSLRGKAFQEVKKKKNLSKHIFPVNLY